MRKSFIAITAIAVLAGSPVFAADMALKAPPPPVPVFTWTGCYFGGHAGYAWGHTTGFDATSTTTFFGTGIPVTGPVYGSTNPSSLIFGAQDGCNYQVNPWLVVGVEYDFDPMLGMSAAAGPSPATVARIGINPAAVGSTTENFQGTLRARLGVTGFNNRALFYATGGAAYLNVLSQENLIGATGPIAAAQNQQTDGIWGWAVGGGVDYAFTDYFILRAEYLFEEFPRYTTFTSGPFLGGPPVPLSTSITNNILRFGMSYKFSNSIFFWVNK
jgi:outer membrane immunogenic protein